MNYVSRHFEMEKYICVKLLELMESKPFHTIKITEFVSFAEIGRSTFYAYFDSIYSVIQKLEDDFIAGLGYEKAMKASKLFDDKSEDGHNEFLQWINYMKDNLRLFRILCGPTGDPGFESRLENWLRKSLVRVAEKNSSHKMNKDFDYYAAYHAGGVLYGMKWWAAHSEDYDIKNIEYLIKQIGIQIGPLLGWQ